MTEKTHTYKPSRSNATACKKRVDRDLEMPPRERLFKALSLGLPSSTKKVET